MIRSFSQPSHFQRGFTLIELLVVIAVIMILVSIAVPNFIHMMERAKVAQAKTFIIELKGSVGAYNTDTHQWPLSGSEHLFAVLGGLSPYSKKSSKNYNPPYQEFTAANAGAETYTKEYSNNDDLKIKQQSLNGSANTVKADSLRLSNPEVDIWRPVLDPWRRPIVYVSPDDLKKRFNDDTSTLDSTMIGLIAMDREKAVNDKGNQANVPFGLNSGQIWSAGPDGTTATADGAPARNTGTANRGLYQPGNLSNTDNRDNDNDTLTDVSDAKGSGNNGAEDDINCWSN